MENNKKDNVTDLTYLIDIANGDNSFIKEMIDVYMQQTPEAIADLEACVKNKDWKKLQAVTHKMKPSFTFFGLKDMYSIIDSIEEYLDKEIHFDLLPEMIAKIKIICNRAMLELKFDKSYN